MTPRICILCVEDEVEVLDAVAKDLAPLEDMFPLFTARSVAEARECVARIEQSRDLLGVALCDHVMPGDSGVELLVELYRNPYTATCRKVLLTGHASLEAMVRAVNYAKLDYYIGKPWTQAELSDVVRRLLAEFIHEQTSDPQRYQAFLDSV
ncbi:MAG: response regulator [Bacteroidetes bacterium]|nr:response regulator [Bacteroidota bacterium]